MERHDLLHVLSERDEYGASHEPIEGLQSLEQVSNQRIKANLCIFHASTDYGCTFHNFICNCTWIYDV